MFRCLCIVAVALALGTAPATAVELVSPNGRRVQPEQRWATKMRIGPPSVTVTVIKQRCPQPYLEGEDASCVMPDGRTMYLSPTQVTGLEARRDRLAHELAHVWDLQAGDDATASAVRARFMQLSGYTGDWWGTTAGASYSGAPAYLGELFADAFSYCASTPWNRWRWYDPFSDYGWEPGLRARAETCRMLRRNVR